MTISPAYQPINISFTRGQVSSKDASLIPHTAPSELTNFVLDKYACPSKTEGIIKYNSTEIGTAHPIRGAITFVGEDGSEYCIVACNNTLLWSSGGGTFTVIKYATENVAVAIDTANYDFEFVLFPKTVSTTLQWMVYVVTDDYPISNTANGTANKYCTISRALRLEISSGVIIAKNIYYDSDSSRTAGADDVEVGQGAAEYGWPQQGKYPVSIFDRIFIFNFVQGTNNYFFSEAQNAEDWTPTTVSVNTGGGKIPDPFTGAIAYGSSILAFTRRGIMNLYCSAGSPANWKEVWLNTNIGCIAHRTIVKHSDGLVYFVSEKGIARTDGRMVEYCDTDITDQISTLAQLSNRKYGWTQSSTSDWDAGTEGSKQLDTSSGQLKQLAQTTQTDWDAGTKANVDTTTTTGSVILDTSNSNQLLGNAGFETGNLNLWTASGFEASVVDPNNSVYCANCTSVGATFEVYIVDSSIDYLIKTLGSSSWANKFIEQTDLTDHIGNVVQISFRSGSSYLTSDSFTYLGGMINFDFKFTPSSIARIDNIRTHYGSIITQSIDYGMTPSSLGNLTAQVTYYSGRVISFSAETKDSDTGWGSFTSIGTVVSSGNYTVSLSSLTPRRYMRIKVIMTNPVAALADPSLHSINVGGHYITVTKDLTTTPASWGTFEAYHTLNSQTISYEMDTSTNGSSWDGWTAVTAGAIPTTTLRRYIRYRITFNTTNYTQIPVLDSFTQNYFLTSNVPPPCGYSDNDRLYYSFTSNGVTYNDHAWIGHTKPVAGLEYTPSPYLGVAYPLWSKCNFIKANVFIKFQSLLSYGYTAEGYLYQISGSLNDGAAFTSTLISGAFTIEDVQGIWRFLYPRYQADQNFSLYFRTRSGRSSWSDWSSAITITSSPYFVRGDKVTLPGNVIGDFIQLKLETTATDVNLQIPGLNLYHDTKVVGR